MPLPSLVDAGFDPAPSTKRTASVSISPAAVLPPTATAVGVPVPEGIVQELVTYMTKTPENPAGVSLNRPFELPAGIQQIRTRAGHATIVQ